MKAEAVVSYPAATTPTQAKSAARNLNVECEFRPGSIRILASGNSGIEAMRAASEAALALIAALGDGKAMIDSVKRVDDTGTTAQRAVISRGSLSKERPRPQTLMGEVTAPRPMPDNQREAFRNFMTTHRLRPTVWAKDAGVSSGEILGFLSGTSRGFSPETAQKLARAAHVSVEDMFR